MNGVGVVVVVATAVAFGVGVPVGSSNRPRRCDAVGEADNAGSGVEVAVARGVIAGFGVDVAIGGAWVGDIAADGTGVVVVPPPPATGELKVVDAAPLLNFFGGAFGGGVASDFIFCRAFLASS